MTNFLSKSMKATLAAVFAMGFVSPLKAEELVLSSWLPPKHPVVTKIMKPWAKQIEAATEGRVTVRMLAKPLGPPPAAYDLAADGVADITYGLHSFTKDDRFIRSRIGQFSFMGNTALAASQTFWNVYTGDLDAQAEHKGTKLLGLFVHGPGMFHNSKKKINTSADFSGLKIRTPGGYVAQLAQGLGIVTQFMGPGEVFEKLSRGVIDGVTFPIEAIAAFKLQNHIKYSMKVPGGMYNTTWFVVMNGAKWDAISAVDKTAIEAISGSALAKMAGGVWDASDVAGASVVGKSDIEVYDASDEVIAAIKKIADVAEAEWATAVAKGGFDGTAAIAKYRAAAN